MNSEKIPYQRKDDKELLGYITQDSTGWQATTIFGYLIARTESLAAAQKVLREQGLSFLLGVWNYYDQDDRDWHACVLKEAQEHQVTVIRTNALGYQDPDDFKFYIVKDPSEEKLVKTA